MSEYQVVEGICGTWYYHLAKKDESPNRALCDAQTMSTKIPVTTWGLITHLNERYCKKCKKQSERKEPSGE